MSAADFRFAAKTTTYLGHVPRSRISCSDLTSLLIDNDRSDLCPSDLSQQTTRCTDNQRSVLVMTGETSLRRTSIQMWYPGDPFISTGIAEGKEV